MTAKHTEQTLLELPMESLVTAYNSLMPATAAGPKTFSTRAKAVARVLALQATRDGVGAPDPVKRIRMLLGKTQAAGWSPPEEAAAVLEASTILAKEHLSPGAFSWPKGYDPVSGLPEVQAPRPAPEVRPAVGRIPSATAPVKAPGAPTIRSISEAMLLVVVGQDPDGRPVGMSYRDILDQVHVQVPGCKTSYACLRWYATHMIERGERLPVRPRTLPNPPAAVETST